MSNLIISEKSTAALKPNTSNARTHTAKQIRQIATSIERFGFNNPILVDADDMIIVGHGRYAAVQLLGRSQVPTIRLDHLSDAQKRAYIIADNRLAELAGWDNDILAIELQYLLDADIDFEITDVGFDTADVDLLLVGDSGADEDEDDLLPAIEEGLPISQPGDLWKIGNHRLLCGDALSRGSFPTLVKLTVTLERVRWSLLAH
jgi:ParB-like chromosome segregation protein Spo0J